MLENLDQAIYSIFGFTMNYISFGSALYFTVYRLDDNITLKRCMYIQVGKNSNCK